MPSIETRNIIGDIKFMRKIVNYSENQYFNGQLVLLGHCNYELKFDALNYRYFIMNQNNELIYLDQLESVQVVKSTLKLKQPHFFMM